MSRQRPALGEPPDALESFPRARLTRRPVVFRGHRPEHGPWWLSADGDGRFDLPPPEGTCYLAQTAAAALRERFGTRLVAAGFVTATFAAQTVVSALHLPAPVLVADTTADEAADFGVTRELATVVPYDLPQRWARALRAARFGGIRYLGRFSTGAAACYAIFGPAGEQDWPVDPDPVPGDVAARAAGIRVVTPSRWVRVIAPPGVE